MLLFTSNARKRMECTAFRIEQRNAIFKIFLPSHPEHSRCCKMSSM